MKFRALTVTAAAVSVLGLAVAQPAVAAATHHPKISVAVNHKSIHVGSSVVLSGKVAPNEHGHRVSLQRYYSRRWHTQKTQKLNTGSRYSLRIEPSHTGTYTYRVYDPKRTGWTAAASRTVHVTVTKKSSGSGSGSGSGGSSSASCYPLTNGGNCYEPGEFCRSSDHGASGVAGNGEAITCEDNNGWRWEPS